MPATSYRISAVAHATGLSVDTIRMWERRYQLVAPARDAAGVRRYSDADVERLRLMRRATMLGHAVGELAALSNDDLRRVISAEGSESPNPIAAAKSEYVENIVDSLMQLDLARAEKQLNEAFFFLEPRDVIIDIMAPLMHRVGENWSKGRLQIVHEHAASQIVRNVSANAFRLAPRQSQMRIVFATPPGEQHDFGISFSANLAVLHGAQVFVLGASLPLEELERGVRRIGADAVVISATVCPIQPSVLKYVEDLDKQLPSEIKILVGGPAVESMDRTHLSDRVRIVETLRAFDDHLDRLGI